MITAAAAVLHALYPRLAENAEIQKTLIYNGLRDRIDQRILRITVSEAPYPTEDEIVAAAMAVLKVL